MKKEIAMYIGAVLIMLSVTLMTIYSTVWCNGYILIASVVCVFLSSAFFSEGFANYEIIEDDEK